MKWSNFMENIILDGKETSKKIIENLKLKFEKNQDNYTKQNSIHPKGRK